MHGVRLVGVVSLAAVSLLSITPTPAVAYRHDANDCPAAGNENLEEVTRAAGASGGALIRTATGVIGRFPPRDRDWNPNCVGEMYGSGVTIFFVRDGVITSRYIHLGYSLDSDGDFPLVGHTWEGWTGDVWYGNGCFDSCLDQFPHAFFNSLCYYKINNVAGTTDWKLWINCDGGGYKLMTTYTSTGYSEGVASTTTYRRGGETTGMRDSWDGLMYRNSQDTWVDWASNVKYADTASNWHAANIFDTGYSVIKDT